MRVLLTGGAGFIGSHIYIKLLLAGHIPCIIDNFSNSSRAAIARLSSTCNQEINFYEADIRSREKIVKCFSEFKPDSVIHLAGLKSVAESVKDPLIYFDNNVFGTSVLLNVMIQFNVKNIVFSSSATVYGEPEYLPIDERHKLKPINPYGDTKRTVEDILRGLSNSQKGWSSVVLRYFNPAGAHESGLIGEDPRGVPNNLFPFIGKVLNGELQHLSIFGKDYDTPDGTGVRDYIHVQDLADSHVSALQLMDKRCFEIFNVGAGKGYSVLEIIEAFQAVSGRSIPHKYVDRREGDTASCWADCSKIEQALNWRAQRGLAEICNDAWRWQSKHRLNLSTGAILEP